MVYSGGDSGRGERGSAAVEYALLIVAVAAATILMVAVLGQVLAIDLATGDQLISTGEGGAAKPVPPPSERDGDSVPRYPSGDPVMAGYPVLVDTASLDPRLSGWIDTEQAVALAPGVYAAYSPAVTDLNDYLDGPVDGDCAMRDKFFPEASGACLSGVTPSPQEPSTP
jgi:hypothetical protein